MPRANSTDKFYIYAPQRSGRAKGKRLIGVNHRHSGGVDNITLEDLLNFLHKHEIEPSRVSIPSHYSALV